MPPRGVSGLSAGALPVLPSVCRDCVWWQSRGNRTASKERWIERAEEEWGEWGSIYLDDHGRLLRTRTLRLRALARRLPVADVEREIASQIELVREAGVEVSHVDSHRHVHKLPAVREALERVLPRFGIRRVRTVQDVYLQKPLTSPTFWVGHRWRGPLAAAFETTEHLYLPSSAHDVGWDEPLLVRCAHLSGPSLEVAVHPGSLEAWRDEERGTILRFAPAAQAAGHELIPWRSL